MTFLFWNLNRRPIIDLVAAIAHENEVDVLILAECEIHIAELLVALNQDGDLYHFPYTNCDSIRIFTRFSPRFSHPVYESARISIRRLRIPLQEEFLLCAAHLPSKLHWSSDSQSLECAGVAKAICDEEDRVGHQRTILVGDLNVNPFEPGVVGASGFHAVMTREIAKVRERTVQGRSYRFFYNPIWSHFGDGSAGPPGTYFDHRAEHVSYFWNIFDQVLLRPDLLLLFRNEDLRILDRVGDTSLTSMSGRPDSTAGSDHLPILFKLEF